MKQHIETATGVTAVAAMTTKQKATKPQLASYLQVCPRQIEKMMAEGLIPFEKYGRRCVRFDLAKVEKALSRFEIKAVSKRGVERDRA